MLHGFQSMPDIYPHRFFVVFSERTFLYIFDCIKSNFFPPFPITQDADFFPQYTSYNSRLLSKFSESCLWRRFSFFYMSFWEHEGSIFMDDAEYFCFSVAFTSTNPSGTGVEPEKRSDVFFPFIKQVYFFLSFHSVRYLEDTISR